VSAVTEIEAWLRIGATVGIGGSGLWLIWFLAKKLWGTVWEGTKEQNLQLKGDLLESRKRVREEANKADKWEEAYRNLYYEYQRWAPPEQRVPWVRVIETEVTQNDPA
jgi:hypothetical protein